MIPGRIPNATRNLGAPPNWDAEKQGPCCSLPVLDADGGMYSAWLPSPEEIAAIVAGGPVLLWVAGSGHPPVSLGVGEPPK